MKPGLLTKGNAAITTREEDVRVRAYELYEVRGRIDGHAEEHWLQAEGEVAGSNGLKTGRASTSKITVKVVGGGLTGWTITYPDDHVVENHERKGCGRRWRVSPWHER